MRKILTALLMGAALAGCIQSPSFDAIKDAPQLRFVAFGDGPYEAPQDYDAAISGLIQNVNAAKPALFVHVGDTHGHYTCSDQFLDQVRANMNAIAAPVLYTPGDNEWTDCHDTNDGAFDPIDRLDYIRKTYFSAPKTLGQNPIALQNQAHKGYPENARLSMNNVGFITAHVVGSNNNFDPNSNAAIAEFQARRQANQRWLEDSFAAFDDMDAIVVAVHANIFIPQSGFKNGWRHWSPFHDFGVTFGKLSLAYDKPVLLLFGDSHNKRVFRPSPKGWPNVHAIEVFGAPDVKALEIAIRPNARRPFSISGVFEN